MVTERDIAGDIPQAAPHQEPQFMSMAMAMVVAAGTCHINSLQLFSCPAAQHSHRKTLVICTSVSKTGAFVGNCYPTIAWPQRRSFELRSRRDASKSLRRRKCCAVRAGGGEIIMEGDVVEYPLPEDVRQGGLYGDRSYGLGAVSELVSDPSSSSLVCHIEPLVMVLDFCICLRSDFAVGSGVAEKNEPPKATWIVDERQDMVVVPLTEVRRLEAWLSMRMVDDRISNPHGEHAEHLWLVEEPLSESSGSPIYDEAA